MTPMNKFTFWLQGLALSVMLLCIATDSHALSGGIKPDSGRPSVRREVDRAIVNAGEPRPPWLAGR